MEYNPLDGPTLVTGAVKSTLCHSKIIEYSHRIAPAYGVARVWSLAKALVSQDNGSLACTEMQISKSKSTVAA
jgi:hypothetical protein